MTHTSFVVQCGGNPHADVGVFAREYLPKWLLALRRQPFDSSTKLPAPFPHPLRSSLSRQAYQQLCTRTSRECWTPLGNLKQSSLEERERERVCVYVEKKHFSSCTRYFVSFVLPRSTVDISVRSRGVFRLFAFASAPTWNGNYAGIHAGPKLSALRDLPVGPDTLLLLHWRVNRWKIFVRLTFDRYSWFFEVLFEKCEYLFEILNVLHIDHFGAIVSPKNVSL